MEKSNQDDKMKNFKQKLIQAILGGIIEASAMFVAGCGTLLNHETYYVNIQAPDDIEWQVYKKGCHAGIDKERPYATGRGNKMLQLSKTDYPDYYFSQDEGRTYTYILKCKTHPVAFLDILFGPGVFFAASIDELTGGATSYDRTHLNVHFFDWGVSSQGSLSEKKHSNSKDKNFAELYFK